MASLLCPQHTLFAGLMRGESRCVANMPVRPQTPVLHPYIISALSAGTLQKVLILELSQHWE